MTSGGYAPYTFGLKNLMENEIDFCIQSPYTNEYLKTYLYSYPQNTVYNGMTSDLKAVVKNVYKKTCVGDGNLSIRTASQRVFLFSEIEVFGKVTHSESGEGTQYSRFTTASTRIKNLSNGSGNAASWWLRSPYDYVMAFCFVSESGKSYNNAGIGGDKGVCFGFCV